MGDSFVLRSIGEVPGFQIRMSDVASPPVNEVRRESSRPCVGGGPITFSPMVPSPRQSENPCHSSRTRVSWIWEQAIHESDVLTTHQKDRKNSSNPHWCVSRFICCLPHSAWPVAWEAWRHKLRIADQMTGLDTVRSSGIPRELRRSHEEGVVALRAMYSMSRVPRPLPGI